MLRGMAILLALAMAGYSCAQAAEEPNPEVKDQVRALITLSQQGVSGDVIKAWLDQQPQGSVITPTQILELKRNGVAEPVIEAFLRHSAPSAVAEGATGQPAEQPPAAAAGTVPDVAGYAAPDQPVHTYGVPDYAPETDAEKWRGPYIQKPRFADPWKNAYVYSSPGARSDQPYEIASYGKDGQEGGEGDNADIQSWVEVPGR